MASPALWLYRALFAAALPIGAPWLLLRAKARGMHRPPLLQRLGRRLPPMPKAGVWMQAVSVGEVAVARPLLAELRRRHPQIPLVLSSTTASGLRMASGSQVSDAVAPFPLDLPGPVRRTLDGAEPRLVILVETELWPELLAECGRRHISVALVNARVSDRSFSGYRPLRRLLRPLLQPLTLVLAQESLDAERLAVMGVPAERIRVTGNIKFDASPPGPPPRVLGDVRALAAGRPVWIAGSTVDGEEPIVLDSWLSLAADLRPFLVLAPRHPERATEALQAALARQVAVVRRTRLDQAGERCDVLVLDTIGELAALFELASIAFVGGSLVPTGGHNPIEPARFGVPVLTGPHVRNFAVVYRRFFQEGAAKMVHNGAELAEAVVYWLRDPPAARAAGAAGRDILARNVGATARTVDALEPLLA